ncbi:unnamed protein product [Adineta ricciae]|uniref:Apple domain-containing protein n=1 Tax=Adineta ricciae TaxID=249248 RepID=A0A815XSK1_ADIRI|nr:unnamed protein product [Adineta ricciae]
MDESVSIKFLYAFLSIFVEQAMTLNSRSSYMSSMTDFQLQCANTTCLPLSTVGLSTVLQCEIACLAQNLCQVASFNKLLFICQLFTNMTYQTSTVIPQMNSILMIVISRTQIPID